MIIKPTRRLFLATLAAALAGPAVVKASALMPISAANLAKLQYVIVSGEAVGQIVEMAGSPPPWAIPCNGLLIKGTDYPDFYRSVRGRLPTGDDDWVHVPPLGEHEYSGVRTADYFYSMDLTEQ